MTTKEELLLKELGIEHKRLYWICPAAESCDSKGCLDKEPHLYNEKTCKLSCDYDPHSGTQCISTGVCEPDCPACAALKVIDYCEEKIVDAVVTATKKGYKLGKEGGKKEMVIRVNKYLDEKLGYDYSGVRPDEITALSRNKD